MTDKPVDTAPSDAPRFGLTRTRVVFLILAVAPMIAGIGCGIESFRAGWQSYVPYWGAAMQTVPANDTATAWWLAGVAAICVGAGTAISATAPKPFVAAASIAGIYGVMTALFFLVLAAIA
ncbi:MULTISPECIES: hypothetical protein [Curtobacterium]|uniref:hypothetical protein n=1 Tax=Curtobacterium TaxID=2034 RepID=UPI0005AC9980|nr:hypothetical protein [Curtobacterium flaccumfaciens]KIQ07685.1 hypothetical protein RU06_10955 [Curtobacterium flaccumfaciens]MCU0116535.1 hypothetical protein [Curtobacterium flaccumfaciens]